MINHDTHRYTPNTLAIHKKGDSPCMSTVHIRIDTRDEGATHYFTIYSEGKYIHLDIEELAQLYPAAINLLHGVPA